MGHMPRHTHLCKSCPSTCPYIQDGALKLTCDRALWLLHKRITSHHAMSNAQKPDSYILEVDLPRLLPSVLGQWLYQSAIPNRLTRRTPLPVPGGCCTCMCSMLCCLVRSSYGPWWPCCLVISIQSWRPKMLSLLTLRLRPFRSSPIVGK